MEIEDIRIRAMSWGWKTWRGTASLLPTC